MAAPVPDAALAPAVRLSAAAAAVAVALLGLAALRWSVQRELAEHIERFNVFPQPEKLIGSAVQRQVFRDSAMLPIYGSSELSQPQDNRADDFFARHPTGFGAFLIGNPGETCLMIASKLAAAGTDARGKQVVVFLSPDWFLAPELDRRGFGVNFSPLHTGILAFESDLSAPLRQAFARRLLEYPEMIGQSPLLERALSDLAQGTPAARADLAMLQPLGALHNGTFRASDAGKLARWRWLEDHPARASGKDESAPIRWQERIDQADAEYQRQTPRTTYSVGPRTGWDDSHLARFRDRLRPEVSPDDNFTRVCASSEEWTDLELLLRTADESGARLLLVCQPLNANFGALQGLTTRGSAFFYDRLGKAVASHHARLETFPDAETDPHFYFDRVHPSAKAWLVYDQRLDGFVHEPAPAPAR